MYQDAISVNPSFLILTHPRLTLFNGCSSLFWSLIASRPVTPSFRSPRLPRRSRPSPPPRSLLLCLSNFFSFLSYEFVAILISTLTHEPLRSRTVLILRRPKDHLRSSKPGPLHHAMRTSITTMRFTSTLRPSIPPRKTSSGSV